MRIARLHVIDDLLQASNRFERRGEELDPSFLRQIDGPFYEWHRNAAGWLDYAVTFEIKPRFGATAGSQWANVALASLAGFSSGYTGIPQPWVPVRQNIEFKAEFLDFKVYRHDNPDNRGEGELIEPIMPGRQVTESAFRNHDMSSVDEAYSGMYVYSPDVFLAPDSSFTFVVFDARRPDQPHETLRLDGSSGIIRQIRQDFAVADVVTLIEPVELRRDAEQGNVEAQYELASWHLGSSHAASTNEGMKLYRLAAEQGHPLAQLELGVRYRDGVNDFVQRDYAEAVMWFKRAAEQGDSRAKLNLGSLYLNGDGVGQDYERAYMWFSLVLSGEEGVSTLGNRTIAGNRIAELETRMTPEQLR